MSERLRIDNGRLPVACLLADERCLPACYIRVRTLTKTRLLSGFLRMASCRWQTEE